MRRQLRARAARALAIGRKIGELEAELRPLQIALAELKKEHALLFSEDAEEEAEEDDAPPALPTLKEKKKGKPAQPPRPQEPKGWQPLPARVLDYLASHDEGGATVNAIGEALGQPNRQTLRATLVSLCKQGKIIRVDHGKYASRVTTIRPTLVLQR